MTATMKESSSVLLFVIPTSAIDTTRFTYSDIFAVGENPSQALLSIRDLLLFDGEPPFLPPCHIISPVITYEFTVRDQTGKCSKLKSGQIAVTYFE